MAYRYSLKAKLPGATWSAKRSMAKTLAALTRRIGGRGPHTLEYGGEHYAKQNDTAGVLRRVRRVLGRVDRVTVHPSRGPAQTIRRHEVSAKPSGGKVPPADTEGTPAVDRIWAGVHAKFDSQWTVRNMGIARNCAGNPNSSEHCFKNAWDFGTDMNVPAAVTWDRVTKMGRWLVGQGLLYQASGGSKGLPVKSVIFMDRYWVRGWATTRRYPGVKHVSHVHTAGFPGNLSGA